MEGSPSRKRHIIISSFKQGSNMFYIKDDFFKNQDPQTLSFGNLAGVCHKNNFCYWIRVL